MDAKSFLQLIYDHFNKTGEWPLYRSIEVDLLDKAPIQEVVNQIDKRFLLIEDPSRNAKAACILTLEGMALCQGSESDIENIVTTARLMADRYIQSKESIDVGSAEIAIELDLSQLETKRVCELFCRFGWNIISGSSRDQEGYDFTFSVDAGALQFRDVQTIEDFLETSERVQKQKETEQLLVRPPLTGGSSKTTWDVHERAIEQKISLSELNLHPQVLQASVSLFETGHFGQAVREAAQRFEAQVQNATNNFEKHGTHLMAMAFNEKKPILPINELKTSNERNEQMGLKFLSMGVMSGIRNVRSHGLSKEDSRSEALEMLSIISFLFRQLDLTLKYQERQ